MDTLVDLQHGDEKSVLEVEFSAASQVNFASAQNGVAVLRKLRLLNPAQRPLSALKVVLESQPPLFQTKTWNIDRLGAGDALNLPHLDVPLDTALLGGLNEAELGQLALSVWQGEERIYDKRIAIDMLARDEWGGVGEMAQLVAAFVSPNDPVVADILKDASRLLAQAGQNDGLDGYQTRNPGRVWMVAGAIWSAITALGISYAVPPASFERYGQKVRDPGRIRAEGLATCLDTTLLLAACYEAAGLNAVVLFSKGHAWTGVWLKDRDFGSVTEPDVMTVRKAADSHEFVMLETTLLAQKPAAGFEQAAAAGRARVNEAQEHEFEQAVDIRRARAARIRPLASHRAPSQEAAENTFTAPQPAPLPQPLDSGLLPADIIDIAPTTAAGRIERWQRKLLDLSLRNRLLNYKDGKQTLPLLCPDIAGLEDLLAGGENFTLLSLNNEDPLGNRDLLAPQEQGLLMDVARSAFARGQLGVPLTRREMDARLVELHRKAKSDMQEGGTNTLFLAAGFLRWKKKEDDTRSYRAPLVLIPVKLSRRSAKSAFQLEHHEDDVRFNATLLELLKRDFDLKVPELEGDLPTDDSGIDLSRIFDIMRHRVREVPGFELVEELALSTFSFAKFLMWKDLVERTDSLRQSRLVRHLVDNPTEPFLDAGAPGLPQARDVDTRIEPVNLFTPLPADSSQLAAILAAQEGHDFVLIGPPGTGKSQTIANMIAQCLAVGKTVLFVAEKSAALDVVHRRLAAHGLADAVLELHSSKADRKAVLNQLGRNWERATGASHGEWVQVTKDLRLSRDRLNAYVAALHRKGTQGFSVYDAIGRVAAFPQAGFTLAFSSLKAHDGATYQWLRRLAADAGRCHEIIVRIPTLDLVGAQEWSFSWQAGLVAQAQALKAAGAQLLATSARLREACGLKPDHVGTPEGLDALTAFFVVPMAGPDVSWALTHDMKALRQLAETVASLLREHEAARNSLRADYPLDRVSTIPLDRLDEDWRMAHTKFWPFSVLAKSSVRKFLQTYATGGAAQPETDIRGLMRLNDVRKDLAKTDFRGCPVFHGAQTDAEELIGWVEAADTLVRSLRPLRGDVSDADTWGRTVTALASGHAGMLPGLVNDFFTAHQGWQDAARSFETLAKVSLAGRSLAEMDTGLSNLLEQQEHLQDWAAWRAACSKAEAVGLRMLVDALEAGALPIPAADAFEAAYARWWLPLAMDASDELRQFTHWSHEDLVTSFRALDKRAAELASEQVLRLIRHDLPAVDHVPKKSELGTLRYQLGLQRPSLPIRTLVSQMPGCFTKLAPCVLMSPLSVAQYLPAGQAAFDVVIFDEASQITTWDAVGAIARGRQAIIVGDPKQLPPTNFFGRTDDGEDELPEDERDLASILDEVVAAGIPTQQLDWHYRSRDEALIAFSNWHYYGGRLVTFPAPQTQSGAVQLHSNKGVYARGQGRTNTVEARAIVAFIIARLEAWLRLPEDQRQTLGVITFNAEQQKLILDLLDDERRRNPELEWFFDDAREEALIVKNLENIQGDERDIMLFSITFGPDAAGKLSMAFGALNGEGGEKRLNVAITRARRELHVFSSIHADDIDLTRTKAVGVRHLKGFLDYAARGAMALSAQDSGSVGPVENLFEQAVKDGIEVMGWELRPQIGVSGFRIDLGVVHPDHAGAFLAGIECDGATYHSSATARDRDKVRQAVLEGLGWSILRIWSADWFRNAAAVTKRVDEKLRALLEADRATRAVREEESREAQAAASARDTENTAADMPPTDNLLRPGMEHEAEPVSSTAAALTMPSRPTPAAQELYPALPLVATRPTPFGQQDEGTHPQWSQVVADAAVHLRAREPASASSGRARGNAIATHFFDPDYADTLVNIISEIADEQGPLPLDKLEREVASLHGYGRTGRRIQQRVQACLGKVECHDEDGRSFIWPPSPEGERAARLRVPFRAHLNRNIRDISRTEIADLMDRNALQLRLSSDRELDLARLAGTLRLSAQGRDYVAACIAWATQNPSA